METCWDAFNDGFDMEYPPGYSRGVIINQQGWFSAVSIGGARERMALTAGENVAPYWYTLNYALAARDSQDNQFVPYPGTAIVAMMATSSREITSFRTRMMQIVDQQTKLGLDRSAVTGQNRFGTARQPFYCMRPPVYLADYGSVLVRCANLDNASNTVQLVFLGLIPRQKTS